MCLRRRDRQNVDIGLAWRDRAATSPNARRISSVNRLSRSGRVNVSDATRRSDIKPQALNHHRRSPFRSDTGFSRSIAQSPGAGLEFAYDAAGSGDIEHAARSDRGKAGDQIAPMVQHRHRDRVKSPDQIALHDTKPIAANFLEQRRLLGGAELARPEARLLGVAN